MLTAAFKLSEDQSYILNNYQQGFASVLATPGSGKTTVITHLIRKLIEEQKNEPASILVLTLTESAAREFRQKSLPLLQNKYRIPEFSTIHSFCNRILSRFHPAFYDLSVLPETKKNEKLEQILARKGLRINSAGSSDNEEINYLELFRDSVIPLFRREPGKFSRFRELIDAEPAELRQKTGSIYNHHLNCLYRIPEVIAEYESFLSGEKFIDFEMMINETLTLLKEQPKVLKFLRMKYRYILEDEAQDSNTVQSEILQLLAGPEGNYLRVGDPNQSIFTTFTGADFQNLVNFYRLYRQLEIKQSNRSTPEIISLANYLVDCYPDSFPSHEVKISPGAVNPRKGWVKIESFAKLEQELRFITDLLDELSAQTLSVAILTRTNSQALEIYQKLTEIGFDCLIHGNRDDDFFNNPVVRKIRILIEFLLYPYSFEKLAAVLNILEVPESLIAEYFSQQETAHRIISEVDAGLFLHFGDEEAEEAAAILCRKLNRLLACSYRPLNEILDLINNLFIEDITQKSAARLLMQMWKRTKSSLRNIEDFYNWLNKHSRSKIRQDLLNEEEDEDYSTTEFIHILTIHKAKGLQWDAVFIPNCSKWDFKDDSWKGGNEKKDLKSVIISLTENRPRSLIRRETAEAEVKESRRVAYVGLTRARKYLALTCSAEGLGQKKNQVSEIFSRLKDFQDKNNAGP